MKVVALSSGPGGLYSLEDTHGTGFQAYGHEIISHGFPTKLQPGQKWVHNAGLVIEIVDPLPQNKWLVKEDVLGAAPIWLEETYIMSAYALVLGLEAGPHGFQRCPRCGSSGALILMNLVACGNTTCPCFTTKAVIVP